MLSCRFCGLEGEPNIDFQLDQYGRGFWCEECDGFTYLNKDAIKHNFILILEDKTMDKKKLIHPVKLSKRLSPYRYPGGKSKIADYLYSHLQLSKTRKLVSPYSGGASFELALLHTGVIEQLHLNDLDTGVYSLWWIIKHMPFVLIERLLSKAPTHQDFFAAQSIIKNDYEGVDMVDAAWASLLVNRLAYSGISKANPLGGKNGSKKALLSRWNPKELIRRIEQIHSLSENIEITQLNALELIEEAYWDEQNIIFIDPPYVEKGKALYHCYYTERDHIELCQLLDSLYVGIPGADIIVTYDYNEFIDSIYNFPEREIIGRTYSA